MILSFLLIFFFYNTSPPDLQGELRGSMSKKEYQGIKQFFFKYSDNEIQHEVVNEKLKM